MPQLHVVMPFYNERDTLDECLERVEAVTLPRDCTLALYLVDDHSEAHASEAAREIVQRRAGRGSRISLQRHKVNRGKGAALQTGFDTVLAAAADTDLVGIQDADLEYDPADFAALVAPLLSGEATAVVGTRWGDHTELPTLKRKLHAAMNRMLTGLSNLMTGYRVNDMECCYKVMTVDVLRRLRPMLTEERFGIEPQIVAGLARLRATVAEIPVTYAPRSHEAGKKIGWRDGVRALYVIARERVRGLRGPEPPAPTTGVARARVPEPEESS